MSTPHAPHAGGHGHGGALAWQDALTRVFSLTRRAGDSELQRIEIGLLELAWAAHPELPDFGAVSERLEELPPRGFRPRFLDLLGRLAAGAERKGEEPEAFEAGVAALVGGAPAAAVKWLSREDLLLEASDEEATSIVQ